MRLISQIASIRTIPIFYDDRRRTVISSSAAGKFLRQNIQGIGAILPCLIRISGKPPVGIMEQIVHTTFGSAPIIKMQQKAILIHFHLVSGSLCVKCKNLLIFRKYYAHNRSPFHVNIYVIRFTYNLN